MRSYSTSPSNDNSAAFEVILAFLQVPSCTSTMWAEAIYLVETRLSALQADLCHSKSPTGTSRFIISDDTSGTGRRAEGYSTR